MRITNEIKWTSNNRVFCKTLKKKRELDKEISCSICGYHRGCNHSRDWNHNNWKRYRKTQYKPI